VKRLLRGWCKRAWRYAKGRSPHHEDCGHCFNMRFHLELKSTSLITMASGRRIEQFTLGTCAWQMSRTHSPAVRFQTHLEADNSLVGGRTGRLRPVHNHPRAATCNSADKRQTGPFFFTELTALTHADRNRLHALPQISPRGGRAGSLRSCAWQSRGRLCARRSRPAWPCA